MMRLRRLMLPLLVFAAAPAAAGLRATYAVEESRPLVVEVADNGDINAEIRADRRIIITAEGAFLVEERFTGSLVTRIGDVAALAAQRRSAQLRASGDARPTELLRRGTLEVNGRRGDAFAVARPHEDPREEVVIVISDDASLRDLASAMARVLPLAAMIEDFEAGFPPLETVPSERELLQRGAPLRYWRWTLRSVEHVPIAPEHFTLPAAPETAAALAARFAPQADDAEEVEDTQMILRAVFVAGRLWLLTDTGSLSSLAQGDSARRSHDLGAPVIDICRNGTSAVAVTAAGDPHRGWTLWRFDGDGWHVTRTIRSAQDSLIALSCTSAGQFLITTGRLINLGRHAGAVTLLDEPLMRGRVRTVIHVTAASIFVGLNAGEWGGGLRRIDRRTGQVSTVARNTSGHGCTGPLNTNCDPVNGIATIPWQPQCVAAAIGLVHFEPHGRITRVCGSTVDQLVAVTDTDTVDPADTAALADAAEGGYGAVAFFGLEAASDALIAVGHNGLYRIDASGTAVRQRWPRFTFVDGVYVSFALPDFVLVLSQLNRRASVSGSAPLLVPR